MTILSWAGWCSIGPSTRAESVGDRLWGEQSGTTEEADGTDQYLVEESPELESSIQQEREHAPDNYTTGYDPTGSTRVGIGSTGGDATKLIRHNEGRHRSDGNHSTREAARDKKRLTEAFCSFLGVTPYQQREAIAAMGTLNLDRFGRQKRLEKVALGTIKVIVEWGRVHRVRQNGDFANISDEDFPTRMLEEEDFCTLLDQHEVSQKDLYSISQLIKRELKKHDYFGHDGNAESGADTSSEQTTAPIE